jgi:hypothetical protein
VREWLTKRAERHLANSADTKHNAVERAYYRQLKNECYLIRDLIALPILGESND